MIYLLLSSILALLLLHMIIEARRNRVKEQTLAFESLPTSFDGYRIFFISDIHRRELSMSIVNKIKDKADLIIIGGDICEKGVPLKRVEMNLKHLSSVAPCLFIWGNNDHEIGVEHLRFLFKKYKITELSNGIWPIQKEEEQLIVASVDDVENDIQLDYEQIPHHKFAILVCHFPDVIDVLKADHPFSLILSGHTHGGQIRIFGFGIAKKGQWIHANSFIQLISNGYGTTGIPLRLGAPAETHLLTLTKAKRTGE
ncbi:metallophosphoesterase family protein [Alkalihalobacillus sp. MEB130]|uniref:metallophosphoesterase n=1 Tax=Alkalihalobacillus sp. MEB130 TaxID=2976704 RepID=UPI0028DE5B2A|nr:metallophosphoesterase [Alkalihalobacillus sp. MEB130]MDT8860046.1 metallophosphoesterase family protein [Alkalihalobacillus sp. MEB130]